MRVVDLFSLKPFDKEGVKKHIEEVNGNVIVVEEHYEAGGAYEAVCGAAAPAIKKIEHVYVTSVPGSAKPDEQLQIYGLDSASIAAKVKAFLA